MEYIIRRKEKEDCFQIAHITTITWNETYKGIVDDKILNDLYINEQKRAINSYNKFDENNNHSFVLEINKKIVGFVKVGKSNDEDYPSYAQIQAIYILKAYKGKGYGKKLIETAKMEIRNMGYDKMIIGCLEGNPSNNFYTHIGGKLIKKSIFKKLNLPENIYYFDKI